MFSFCLHYEQFGSPADVLALNRQQLCALGVGHIRVRMLLSPVNPSDLIPITGAYRHRIQLPCVAGYEGVGVVSETHSVHASYIGKRVLPLRAGGTWQSFVDCDPAWAVTVPDDVDDLLAARAYINPLTALLMLREHDPRGKTVLVTAANSSCAALLIQWAFMFGAKQVFGVYRSERHRPGVSALGAIPLQENETQNVEAAAANSDIVYDAVGGELATALLRCMRREGTFLSYGLLSGMQFSAAPKGCVPKLFQLRQRVEAMNPWRWQKNFQELWPLLKQVQLPNAKVFAAQEWQNALRFFAQPGRSQKPLFAFNQC